MDYILDIFSPATWKAFLNSDQTVSGVSGHFERMARNRVHPGDIFICYVTKLSRWCGVLEATSEPYHVDAPLFAEGDGYTVRFDVKPILCLPPELSIPIKNPEIWSTLSLTKNYDKDSSAWTGPFRISLNLLPSLDGEYLYAQLERQATERQIFPLSEADKREWGIDDESLGTTEETTVAVVHEAHDLGPVDSTELDEPTDDASETTRTQSIKMQAKLAEIGARMGLAIWVPANDRMRVLQHVPEQLHTSFRDQIGLFYPNEMLSTIKQIDVLWLQGNGIVRAFEVEHTTAIYSGILRMTDLLALQPNFTTSLHIVAPDERQEKVLEEIGRPTFKQFSLSSYCSFLPYSRVYEIANLPLLKYLPSGIINDYEVRA